MAANEEGDEVLPRGNEWEFINLTASAYAAAPAPEHVDLNHDSHGKSGGENEIEASNPMFVSDHFVFPPSQHENLPLETEGSEKMDDVKCGEFDIPQLNAGEVGGKLEMKYENDASFEELMSDKFTGDVVLDEISNTLLASSADLQDGIVFEKEKSVSSSAESQPSPRLEEIAADTASDSRFLNRGEDKFDCEDLPCEAWWKRRVVSLFSQAKEANSCWSVFITAAVMGIVIIGHHWHKERWQVLQIK